MPLVRHDDMRPWIRPHYTPAAVRALTAFLRRRGTLDFKPLPTGLFPAAALDPAAAAASGYGRAWVRDNVYVALAHAAAGDLRTAAGVAAGLAAFYRRHRRRFSDIVAGRADPAEAMNRPHVRFDGARLAELPEPWPHAQNDALGYFLWLTARLAAAGVIQPEAELLALVCRYLRAIAYWRDADSGHWEEGRKVQASSIGAVVAGLRALRAWASAPAGSARRSARAPLPPADLDDLIATGEQALAAILPAECVQPDPRCARRHDAALLFLVYPLEAAGEAAARAIVAEVVAHLMGEHGIRRYRGDSYWTADYRERFPAAELTADPSERLARRNALHRPGEEAQWCLFDPILAAIFGRRYLRGGDREDRERQVFHLHRSLGQLTGRGCPQGELRCPEAYCLAGGRWVPNDHVPLLWTQANLWLALAALEKSAARG
jgi:phosphorylase kinase alpha/beta subunit